MNDGNSPDQLTQDDLRLGQKAAKYTRILCVVGSVVCLAIALFVFMSVPWDTRLPYDGKYNRSGSGIPMQVAMIPALAVLVGFWISGRKPDAHKMNRASRGVAYRYGYNHFLGLRCRASYLGARGSSCGRYAALTSEQHAET
jgi:hypothetical protein